MARGKRKQVTDRVSDDEVTPSAKPQVSDNDVTPRAKRRPRKRQAVTKTNSAAVKAL